MLDNFNTDGTFDRVELTKCCQDFVHCPGGPVRQYPGPNSVGILDRATVHSHLEIIHYLRSVGVVPICFPAYCPLYNPILIFVWLSEARIPASLPRVKWSRYFVFCCPDIPQVSKVQYEQGSPALWMEDPRIIIDHVGLFQLGDGGARSRSMLSMIASRVTNRCS